MKEASLPSPSGNASKSMHLRRIAATAISALEQSAKFYTNGIHPKAAQMAAFFTACAAACTALTLPVPAMTLTTAGSAVSLAVGATLATTVAKDGSSGTVTYTSSNTAVATVNSSGVVTGVSVGAVTITASMAQGTAHRAASRSVGLNVTAA